jgi:hypothetical protein
VVPTVAIVLAAILLASVTVGWDLGTAPLADWDEGHHAKLALDMQRTGEWLVLWPRRELEPWSVKPLRFIDKASHEQALAYLTGGHPLVVMPSVSPTCRHIVAECAELGIPFLAARTARYSRGCYVTRSCSVTLLFEPNAKDLLRCLVQYLKTYQNSAITGARKHGRQRMALAGKPRSLNTTSPAWNRRVERRQQSPRSEPTLDNRRVITVAIPHHNLGAYLPETLDSVAAQTYGNLEVLVYDDGSSETDSVVAFEEQAAPLPQFRFVRQPQCRLCLCDAQSGCWPKRKATSSSRWTPTTSSCRRCWNGS